MEDAPRALASYDAALRLNPVSVQALFRAAEMHKLAEDHAGAAELFCRALAAATTNSPPHSPHAVSGHGAAYPLNTSEALGEAWGGLAHCYLMVEELGKAYTCYQQAIAHQGQNQPTLWYGIGILYDRYGSLDHAEEAFATVIKMDPKFDKANEIYFRLGIIYKQQKNSRASLSCFQYILANPPRPLTEIDIWFQIGHVYEQQQEYDAAKDAYDRVLQANPNHAKVLQQLGGLYHRRRASFYDADKSVAILTKSLENDATDSFSWYLLGRAYMALHNFSKAYEAYQQAVYRDGKNPAYWCSIGVLYYNINQFHDSLDAYSRAIRINPYLSEIWFNLGALYESCNDQMADAVDAYQRTLQLDPSNTAVAQRLEEIRQHQTRGVPLGQPAAPSDISPTSASWAIASNPGGPAAQAGMPAGAGPGQAPTPPQPHAPIPQPHAQPQSHLLAHTHNGDGAHQHRPPANRSASGGSTAGRSPMPPMHGRYDHRPQSGDAYAAPPPLAMGISPQPMRAGSERVPSPQTGVTTSAGKGKGREDSAPVRSPPLRSPTSALRTEGPSPTNVLRPPSAGPAASGKRAGDADAGMRSPPMPAPEPRKRQRTDEAPLRPSPPSNGVL